MADQAEKAFQKQETIFVGRKRVLGKKIKSNDIRFWKNIGLGFKTPQAAIEGTYIDKKCPFTGNVSIRGRLLRGIVHSTKMKRTITVRRNYLHFHPKYGRLNAGDEVTIGQCRPLSKTVRFNVIRVDKRAAVAKSFQKF